MSSAEYDMPMRELTEVSIMTGMFPVSGAYLNSSRDKKPGR